MFKRILMIIALFVVGISISWGVSALPDNNRAIAQSNRTPPTQNSQINAIDRQYILEAGHGGVGNIMLRQLALQKSNSSQVKDFANAEIQEQTQVKSDLTKIAPSLGVTLPTTPTPKFQAVMARLSQLEGDRFDQAYMDEGGVNAHLENAALFQREAAFGQNPELVSLANRGLPIITQHFNTARAATNYQIAQVSRTYNNPTNTSGNTLPRQRNTMPSVPQ